MKIIKSYKVEFKDPKHDEVRFTYLDAKNIEKVKHDFGQMFLECQLLRIEVPR